ncbi:MAG: hypothetical protein EAZ89_02080 [Bacteroidetes bacterium]|nr:MAG: hypothetical protein EAZ89_02080 [Bacteroidota bacterium]
MLWNYLLMTIRSIRNQKVYAFINILGLSVGLSCCLLIMLYVSHELSYDRQNPDAKQIFRVITRVTGHGNEQDDAITQYPLAPALKADIPEVEYTVRVATNGSALLANGTKRLQEEEMLFADSAFYVLFPANFVAGDPKTALAGPNRMVLTESAAKKYFGNENPMGRTLRVDNLYDAQITGIIRDLPPNVHLRYEVMTSLETLMRLYEQQGFRVSQAWFAFTNLSTYVKLYPNTQVQTAEAKLPAFVEKNLGALLTRIGAGFILRFQPMTDVHLYPMPTELLPGGSMTYVYLFTVIAVVILLIACFNYMNLDRPLYPPCA